MSGCSLAYDFQVWKDLKCNLNNSRDGKWLNKSDTWQ